MAHKAPLTAGQPGPKTAIQKVILTLGIVVPTLSILLYSLPLIPIGVDSLSMIRHFDQDESALIDFATRLYEHGLLPQEMHSSYPKFFYYLCGLFLYPYTFFYGPDTAIVTMTFRSVNMCAMVFTVVLINLIGLRFFKSATVGSISALLFALTPSFLPWGANSRPHPVEILFITAAIYYCLTAIETERIRTLWKAVLLAGLAAGTKFGGIFLLPTITLVYAYLLWNRDLEKERLRPDSRLGSTTACLLLAAGCGVFVLVHYGIFFITRSSTGLTVVQELGWMRAVASMPFNLGIGVGITFLGLGVLLFVVNGRMVKSYGAILPNFQFDRKSHLFKSLFGYKVTLFLIKISFAVLGLFLLTNFDFLVFPEQNGLIYIKRILVTSLGEQLQYDPNWWNWLTLFPGIWGMGMGGVLMIVYYLSRELHQVRSLLQGNKSQRLVLRLVPLSYTCVLLGFLMVGINYRFDRYLLPVYLFLFMLGVDALARIPQRFRNHRRVYLVVCTAVVLLCLGERLSPLLQFRTSVEARRSDSAVKELGPWLIATYPKSTKIMSDDGTLYIPESFESLLYWKASQRQWSLPPGISKDAYHTLSESVPRVFIRSNFDRIDTTRAAYDTEVAYLKTHYSVVNRIPYRSKAMISHPRDEIVVYEKNQEHAAND